MKFAVKAWSKGRARAGVIQFVVGSRSNSPLHPTEIEIETPALLLSTRKGLPFFISPDLLPSLPSPDSHLLQFSPLHFLEGITPETISAIGGLHEMVGLHEYGFAAVPRDSIVCLPHCDCTNKLGASFETPFGRILIKPSEYMKFISSMKPNSWTSLADEVPAWVSEKRNKTSVDRTVRWLDDCIALSSKGGNIFGAIVGGSSVEERRRSAQEVAKRNVSGYWIGGFGLGESMEDLSPLLNAVTDCLPEQKPRQICGLGLPEEVLQGIDSGVDLFDASYIYNLTTGGFAVTFPLERIVRNVSDSKLSNKGSDGTKINLNNAVYRKDNSPIVDGCRCYSCQNHTKAYISHLLNVNEMLALILLEIHNTHHYLGFFRAIREAIKGGKFEEFQHHFIEDSRDHIFAAALSA
ncbi:hypothetical protein RHGRI_005267 [Rhododendron griersonianum]|uniref:Queuine tRNA-ribosyltransferase accessory subunit 2 n=1 Tax=Rhododendron griersonianum TaxID=479676 RepID=A0AAV6LEE8_9ERIC|nr:hypothetical protein RHGRI_005267 [Rhododendron griersonianum]KAG5562481.1 hypothetical protein RHGRI_005267 [Rhododendron griersonianum]